MNDIEMCLEHPPKIDHPYWVREDCPYCKVESLQSKLTAAEKENAELAAQVAQAGELMELVDRATYLIAREPETDNWHLPAKRILSRPAPEAWKRLREEAERSVWKEAARLLNMTLDEGYSAQDQANNFEERSKGAFK